MRAAIASLNKLFILDMFCVVKPERGILKTSPTTLPLIHACTCTSVTDMGRLFTAKNNNQAVSQPSHQFKTQYNVSGILTSFLSPPVVVCGPLSLPLSLTKG